MKIRFIADGVQKRRIRREPGGLPALPKTLAVYRTGRDGYVDMRAAVSLLMPLARELERQHAENNECFPALTPDTVKIENRIFTLDLAAADYRGVIYPGFSAPEMYTGATLGVPTDIYSFAAVLFYLMTGDAPENAYNLMMGEAPLFPEQLYDDMRAAESIYVKDLIPEADPFEIELEEAEKLPVIPDDVIDREMVRILGCAMAIDADARYGSMTELIEVLAPYNTKAALIYPVLLSVNEDDLHRNLLVKKRVHLPRKSRQKAGDERGDGVERTDKTFWNNPFWHAKVNLRMANARRSARSAEARGRRAVREAAGQQHLAELQTEDAARREIDGAPAPEGNAGDEYEE